MKPKILVVCPNYLDATSFYRCGGPLTQLQREGKVELVFDDSGSWPTLKLVDLVFFQRPQEQAHLDLLEKVIDAGLPVWVDYDDLLLEVPASNPNYLKYWNPETQRIIQTFLANANVVSLSTAYLKNAYQELIRGEAVVIPNAWDDQLYPKKLEATKPGIVWRGSSTHDEDLYSVKASLENIDKQLEPKWSFLGNPFWLATQGLTESTTYPWKDLASFQKNLEHVSATVAIVPLVDNPFNRSKSNIAWIEASRVGAVVVAPAWDEWKKPGVMTYTHSEGSEFYDNVAVMLDHPAASKANNKASWDYIQAHLRLSQVNKQRLRLIRGLL